MALIVVLCWLKDSLEALILALDSELLGPRLCQADNHASPNQRTHDLIACGQKQSIFRLIFISPGTHSWISS